MNGECSKTPYNSVYESLLSKSDTKKELENQYVNLPSPHKEQVAADELAAKLKKLEPRKRSKKKKSASKSFTEESRSSATSETTISKLDPAYASYIGVVSPSGAESKVTTRGDFALYHQFDVSRLDALSPSLPLMLVYFTTTKKHRHYPVRASRGATNDMVFSVDCGYPNVRKHHSLALLVHYYKTFGSIKTVSDEDSFADAFSWWLE